ncbi:LysR substrate-binding domain-containing protein [Mameliella sediminis]|uniref:LysR substrate-binding domain-containing protein n=1 Tax=Mameliella sediminis TaxID=2836866 RepID=UPI001C4627C0|nr:LysR substrate-binding domain-containing protein [Mameliella sediminis]MBV7395913.1 LysR family transcriptional regulator [Mameliella sediminis]
MTLSLRTLETLRTVAESGSYAAAARQLNVTQPGISQQVRKLEEDYGVELFVREKGRLHPTPLCERLCDSAERVISEYQSLEQMLRRHGSLTKGELSVGLGNAMPGMSVIAAFNKAYPQVTLEVTTGSHDKIMRQVINHTVDVGILPEVPKDARFRRKTLLTNNVVAIVALSHPLAAQEEVTCEELLRHRLIFRTTGSSTQKVLDRYFRRHEVSPAPFLTLDNRDGVYEAVVNGMGVGFVWRTGTGRNEDVKQLRLLGADTSSAEVVFAPVERRMETLNALFGLIDGLALP